MKKYSKLLVLLLTLVLTVTAFTVVSFAEETTTVPTPKESLKNYDGYEDGAIIQNGSSKKGAAYAVKQDDGNVYMLMTYEAGDGTNAENIDTGVAKNYIRTYPYTMISFDIMSPQGQHASDHFLLMRLYNGGSSVGYFSQGIYFNSIGLSTTPYEWQHVSIVIEQDEKTLDFHQHVFVNGKFVDTITDSKNTATISAEGYDRSNLTINYMKFSASRTASQADKDTAIDNFRFSHFKAGASIEQMANYYYKDWKPLYKYTIGTLEGADGATVYYDDFDKLLRDAGDTDVIKLKCDLSDVLINENAVIDTNIYAEDGVTVTGNYAFDFKSSDGYVAEVANGIYTITKSTQLADVKWDPACEGECDCFAQYGGHRLSLSTIAALGEIPEYPNETPTFDIVDGLKKELIGWSYENDGTVDQILPISAEDVAKGTITIYPVYKSTQYSFEYVNGSTVTYHFEDEFATVIKAAKSGSTLKLHTDVTSDVSVALDKKNLTLDLNGFTLKKENILTNTYNAVNVDGVWQKDGDAISTEGSAGSVLFLITGNGYTLNLITSRPGAAIYHSAITRTVLKSGDEVVSDTATVTKDTTFISYQGAVPHTLNIIGDITFYCGIFVNNDWNSNVNAFYLNIDGATFYQVNSTAVFMRCNEGGFYNFNNAKFFTSNLFYDYTSSGGQRKTVMTLENCDVVGGSIRFGIPASLTVINSRIYSGYTEGKSTLSYGAQVTGAKDVAIDAGYVLVEESVTRTLNPLANAKYEYDAETGKPVYTFETVPTEYTTLYTVKKCSEVAESITDVNISMLYYTNFNMMLYLPVTEGTAIKSVSGFEGGSDVVKINGTAYYAYRKACSTANASDTVSAAVTYTVDDKEYRQAFNVSALVYAELILSHPMEQVETVAVANMVRFIKEARTAAGLEIPEKIAALEALYTLEDYKAAEEYDDLDAEFTALAGAEISFAISGSNAAYLIKLPEAVFAGAENAAVSVKFTDGALIEGVGEYVAATDTIGAYYKFTTTKTRVYDIAEKAIEITVTLEGAEPITVTYSVGAYINATDNALAKAMYEFGIAAKAYREYLESL